MTRRNPRPRALVLGVALAILLSVPAAAGRIPLIRIGLAQDVDELRLDGNGAWHLGIVGSHLCPTRVPAGEGWTFRGGAKGTDVRDGESVLRGTVPDTLFAYPDDPENGSVKLNGCAYRGQILIWCSTGHLTAVNVCDLESYLRAVLPPELGPQPPEQFEALKAQAVAARSYTLAMLNRRQDHGFDVLPTVEDQVYGGIPSERPLCTLALEETRGVVALSAGAPICAYYSSTCGGHTAAPEEVWKRPAASYLRPVRDLTSRVERSFCASSPWFHWREEWEGSRFEAILRRSLPQVRGDWKSDQAGKLVDVSIQGRSVSQRVSRLHLQFQKSSVDLCGDEIRWVLRRPQGGEPLRSALLNRVEVGHRRGAVSRVRITGQGYGHGVGMCQFGAMGMAKAGYSYDQIISFYYRGSDLRRFY